MRGVSRQSLAAPVAVVALLAAAPGTANARDSISIVGSSTVYPFAALVAERFGRTTRFRTPRIEATGSGGGLKLFCKGLGLRTPDITNASRRIKASEIDDCTSNGVDHVVELLVGYDGIAIASAAGRPPLNFTIDELYRALAKQVPDANGRLVDNPNRYWRDIHPRFPLERIEVLGPPPTSGTRDAFVEIVLGAGARANPALARLEALQSGQSDKIRETLRQLGLPDLYESVSRSTCASPSGESLFRALAYAVREDGGYVEAGENDNLIIQKLQSNRSALGIFGYAFLEENPDKVQGALINGVLPSYETIADGSYPVSRPLYLYVKGAHVGKVPGIREFALEFLSERSMGEYGYLSERGLVPPSEAELIAARQALLALEN